MTMPFDPSAIPDDPVEALAHLLETEEKFNAEVDEAYGRIYFQLRMIGQLDVGFELGRHSRSRILAMIRARNLPGRAGVTWGDGLDRTSSAAD